MHEVIIAVDMLEKILKALAKRTRKLAKPELAYGLAMGGQTDSQVGSQVAKSRKFHAYTDDLRSTCVDLRWVAKWWKPCVDLGTNFTGLQNQRRQVDFQSM